MSSRSPSPQFTPQESGSDFASIVDTDLLPTPWVKLNRKERLARWHKKYWDKCMAIEERAWLSTQPRRRGDEDKEGTDAMDVDVHESIDEDSEDMDDEYISGCYLLDVALLMNRKMWIRADYIRIYNAIEIHYKKNPAPSYRAPSAVVTGQPGVGQFQNVFVWVTTHIPFSKERAFGSTTPYVGGSLKGNLSYGTSAGSAISSWTRVFTRYRTTSRLSPSRLSYGLLSTLTSPKMGSLPILFHTKHATTSSTPRLHAKNGGRVCTRPHV